ncbi:MAG TPA: phosphate acyltransferase PlsX [bacterium]|nr:phosphate acyltransferase PlsX [bacterium]
MEGARLRVAIDAMGGDYAPREVVGGAVLAARELGVEVILVGPTSRVSEELASVNPESGLPIRVLDAPEVIGMAEAPAMALRRKRQASILVAAEALRRGEADAVVSAGNTGAAMAAALLTLGRIEGIDRPAIAAVLPTLRGRAIMVDVGANVDCRPKHLLQFAIMGSVYANRVLGIAEPRLALMSNGAEDTKGNEAVIQAADLLRHSGVNFIGNVEGRDFFSGAADVAVCDGFVGNLLLKFGEGLAVGIFTLLREELSRGILVRLGVLLATPRLRALARRMDYTEYGGAPLLGVNGICIITHGSSKAKAIRNSIALAADSVHSRMVEAIRADIARLSHLSPGPAPTTPRDREPEGQLPLPQRSRADA